MLTVLSILGAIARRASLSPIPLYLLAGRRARQQRAHRACPRPEEFIDTGAAIGVVLLLLVLGLEFTVDEFSSSLQRHLPSAGVDLVLNAAPGAVAGWLLGLDTVGIVALAGATYISSSGIVARLLTDLRRLGNRETPAVLSVLVLEDLAMAVYLPILAVLASGGGLRPGGAGGGDRARRGGRGVPDLLPLGRARRPGAGAPRPRAAAAPGAGHHAGRRRARRAGARLGRGRRVPGGAGPHRRGGGARPSWS